jgi:hypothetical protein
VGQYHSSQTLFEKTVSGYPYRIFLWVDDGYFFAPDKFSSTPKTYAEAPGAHLEYLGDDYPDATVAKFAKSRPLIKGQTRPESLL